MFTSSLLGYLFLGFFALIIVCQLVPAVMLAVGLVKGVLSTSHTSHAHVSSK